MSGQQNTLHKENDKSVQPSEEIKHAGSTANVMVFNSK